MTHYTRVFRKFRLYPQSDTILAFSAIRAVGIGFSYHHTLESSAWHFPRPAYLDVRGVSVTTTPSNPVHGQRFVFAAAGNGFDSTAQVVFTGPGCVNGCPVSATDITLRSAARIEGSAVLAAGSFSVTVRNSGGQLSNPRTMGVTSAPGGGANGVSTLTNNQIVSGTITQGQELHYQIPLPGGVTQLRRTDRQQ